MKKLIATVATALLLCSPAAFAQNAGGSAAPSAQGALDTLNGMTPQQKQQTMQSGMDQMQNMSPEQLAQFKAMYDSMTPEQKQQMEAQVQQQMDSDPKLKSEAEQKLQSLTPAQKKQLEGTGQ